jgi:rubrerythrin
MAFTSGKIDRVWNLMNLEEFMDETMQATALACLRDERNGAYLYESLAQVEKDSRLAEVYRRMAAVENKHADEWVESAFLLPPQINLSMLV